MTKEEFDKEFAQQQRPDNVPAVTSAEKQEAQQMLTVAKLQADVDALKKSQEQGAAILATLMK
ncbi:hypothetical protein IR117_06475 [Streptococcus danieliae]|nr:hypothetical protein [Streptococcus danieliae]